MADPLWSARALASLTAQDDYLRPLNAVAADSVLSEIERLAALIAEFPEMGRRIDGMRLRYHVTAHYRYRVIYRVRDERVEIVEVLHPRRRKDSIGARAVEKTSDEATRVKGRSTAGRPGQRGVREAKDEV